MQCPIDQTELVRTEREGVEIDYCPTCRGVWLDRGELDKIIKRANQQATDEGASSEENTGRRSPREAFQTPTVAGMSGKVQPLGSRPVRDDDRQQGAPDQSTMESFPSDDPNQYRVDERPNRTTSRRSFLEDLFDFG